MDSAKDLPVAAGLAAAAHLLERGPEPLILEAGPAGHLLPSLEAVPGRPGRRGPSAC
jgi:hypothetical protein